ncbi:hypothetical protein ACWDTP_13750 [Mycobacterium sp. NPDC003449]
MPANTLRADTHAIRALGAAHTVHAEELAAVAAALRTLAVPAGLGPVGDRFLSVFTRAVAEHSNSVAALAEAARAAGVTAGHSAAAYDASGLRAAGLLPRV